MEVDTPWKSTQESAQNQESLVLSVGGQRARLTQVEKGRCRAPRFSDGCSQCLQSQGGLRCLVVCHRSLGEAGVIQCSRCLHPLQVEPGWFLASFFCLPTSLHHNSGSIMSSSLRPHGL